jgi:hypothetical protein
MTQWLPQFDFSTDDETLKKMIFVEFSQLFDLGQVPVSVARLRLESALKNVFIPTTQILRLLREMLSIASEHSRKFYPDERTYRENLYKIDLVANAWPPICLTGLAGNGKSEVLSALCRILLDQGATISAQGLPPFPLQLIWAMRMWVRPNLMDMLRPFLNPLVSKELPNLALLIRAVAKRAYACGVSLVVVDEFQFVTLSTDANAKAAQMLMQLARIGPPLVYACNYSLLHKLFLRPQEERHRLLSNILVLRPDPPQSQDWINTIKGQVDVAPAELGIDPENDAEAIHRYTFGIKRLSADLLVRAYSHARETGNGVARLADVEWAYRSSGFSLHRNDVELLMKQVIENKKARNDLWCPFPDEPAESNVIEVPSAIKSYKERINQELLKSSLPAAERKTYDEIAGAAISKKQKAAPVYQIKRNKLTKENLLDAMEVFNGQALPVIDP